jgi:hypothetical protein
VLPVTLALVIDLLEPFTFTVKPVTAPTVEGRSGGESASVIVATTVKPLRDVVALARVGGAVSPGIRMRVACQPEVEVAVNVPETAPVAPAVTFSFTAILKLSKPSSASSSSVYPVGGVCPVPAPDVVTSGLLTHRRSS